MLCGTKHVPVYREQFLSTNTNYATSVISGPIPVEGNKVVLDVVTIQVNGVPTVTYELQGTYNGGRVWRTIANITQDTFGNNMLAQTGLDFSHIRVAVTIVGNMVSATFDADLTFSCQ
ncbi:MAG: hypothetical protein HYZ53_25015 [Planctomycetes bacterium]|nr:hypothetical protein [Planctomycetota bacterium]